MGRLNEPQKRQLRKPEGNLNKQKKAQERNRGVRLNVKNDQASLKESPNKQKNAQERKKGGLGFDNLIEKPIPAPMKPFA